MNFNRPENILVIFTKTCCIFLNSVIYYTHETVPHILEQVRFRNFPIFSGFFKLIFLDHIWNSSIKEEKK